MQVLFQSAFNRVTGYGNDAVDTAMALERAGADVMLLPTAVTTGLPRAFLRLLEKHPRNTNEAILAFAPPGDIRPWTMTRKAPVRVGWTMWERSVILPEELGWGDLKDPDAPPADAQDGAAYRGLDLLLVTTPMNVDAFRRLDAEVPIQIQPNGVDTQMWRQSPRKGGLPCMFLAHGLMSTPRKNVWALLETWRQLKQDRPDFDGHLHVHSVDQSLHPLVAEAYGPNLSITSKALTHEELLALYHACDVYVSTARGEGNNKPAMQFMATGGPIIATDWSGHQNYLTTSTGWPVAGQLVPAQGRPEALEFEVDRQALAAAIIDAWEHPEERERRGHEAARLMSSAFSWDVVGRSLLKTLESIHA